MNEIWAIVIFTQLGWGGTGVTHLQFSSKQSCEAARSIIIKKSNRSMWGNSGERVTECFRK